MPIRHDAPVGAPTWIDLASSDVKRCEVFYGTVFGWTFQSAGAEYGGYVNAALRGHPVAGLMANNPEGRSPDGWNTYFHTADIKATVSALTAASGAICIPPMEVSSKGFMSMAIDPAGASFGLWQPLEHRGFEMIGEAGAPVWHELTTRDHACAVKFYREVFGWRTESIADTDEFRYTTAQFEGQQLLGVMDGAAFLPEGVQSHWAVYFGADDVDKTLQVIVENGGAVLRPANDTPYGRLAQAADPSGAVFNLSSLRS